MPPASGPAFPHFSVVLAKARTPLILSTSGHGARKRGPRLREGDGMICGNVPLPYPRRTCANPAFAPKRKATR